jgi:hypothetical protein
MLEAGKKKRPSTKKISKPYILCLAFDLVVQGLARVARDKQRLVCTPFIIECK